MASVNSITFDILAKDRASRTLTQVGTAAEKTGKKFTGLKKAVALGGVATAVVKFGKDSVNAFKESQDAQLRLQDAFSRFPRIADSSVSRIDAIASSLQNKTKADDEAVKSGAAVLAQFVSSGRQLETLTPLVVDYAQKTGRDVPQAATTLGKAFLGNTRALKELGINYKLTGDKAKDAANITELLRQKVGGFAEKEGKTAAGQAAILGNRFNELQETVGAKLLPALLKLVGAASTTVDWINRNKTAVLALSAVLLTGVAITKAYAVAMAVQAAGGLKAFAKATKAATVAQWALNVAVSANPYVIAAAALVALGAAAVYAYKRFDTFHDVVNATAKEIANRFLGAVETIVNAFDHLVGAAAKLPGPLGAPFRAVQGDVHNALIAIHNLQGAINAVHSKTVHVTVQTNFIGGTSGGRGGGRRQHGGPVTAGRAYIVGERRPELFVPNQSGRILPSVPASGVSAGGPIALDDKTIRKLGEVMGRVVLAGFGAGSAAAARHGDLLARAG